MPKIKKGFGVSFDLAGCPNRCRHCWIEHKPNKKIPLEKALKIFNEFKYYDSSLEVEFESWYREPDYIDNYKEVYNLTKELNGRVTRFELASIFRASYDQEYIKWLKEVGPRKVQMTFFGMKENQDYYFQRKGTFKRWIDATNDFINNGIIPRWQLFITKRNLKDLNSFVNLIESLELERRVNELGEEFEMFLMLPCPDGHGYELENDRITEDDVKLIPDYLVKKTLKYKKCSNIFDCLGYPEYKMVRILEDRYEPFNDEIDLFLMVDGNYDVYTNLGEQKPWSKLGNVFVEGIDVIMNNYINDSTMYGYVNTKVEVSKLCREFGNGKSNRLYSEFDLIKKWYRDYFEKYYYD